MSTSTSHNPSTVFLWGGGVARQLDAAGVTVSLLGTLRQDLDVDATPTLSTADAALSLEQAQGERVVADRQLAPSRVCVARRTRLIYPLSAAKLLGVAAVVIGVSPFLENLASAGFFYHLSLALSAHNAVGDGPDMMVGATAGTVLLAGSFQWRCRARGARCGEGE